MTSYFEAAQQRRIKKAELTIVFCKLPEVQAMTDIELLDWLAETIHYVADKTVRQSSL